MLFTLLDAPKAEICHMKLAKWLLEHFPLLKTGDPKEEIPFKEVAMPQICHGKKRTQTFP